MSDNFRLAKLNQTSFPSTSIIDDIEFCTVRNAELKNHMMSGQFIPNVGTKEVLIQQHSSSQKPVKECEDNCNESKDTSDILDEQCCDKVEEQALNMTWDVDSKGDMILVNRDALRELNEYYESLRVPSFNIDEEVENQEFIEREMQQIQDRGIKPIMMAGAVQHKMRGSVHVLKPTRQTGQYLDSKCIDPKFEKSDSKHNFM